MTDERRPDIGELLSLVELPGPLPDGAEDALWTATAELYERISAREHESEAEIIRLSPDRSDPAHRGRSWLLAGVAALVAVLAIGLAVVTQWDDGEEPVTTSVPLTTTTTTTTASTTTTVPPTVPGSGFVGIVWESADDPGRVNTIEERPAVVDGPLSARISAFVMTPGPDESQYCAQAVEVGSTGPTGEERVPPEIDSCLIVEWQFDVGEEAANNGFMDARDAVTADGEPVEPLVYDVAMGPPGGSASGSVVFPNLGPGSRISIGYQVALTGGGIIFERWEVVVPDAFQPIDWFEDQAPPSGWTSGGVVT